MTAIAGPMEPRSPLQHAPALGSRLGIDLWIKRDDLLPSAGGGSKVRAAGRIIEHIADLGNDSVVTTGGTQSNHARVVALEAARRGWRCRLVLHGDPGALDTPRGNLLLMCLAGAEISISPPDQTSSRVRAAVADLHSQGLHPFVIPGGGHLLQGVLAYVDAVREVAEQCRLVSWEPAWVVHASGTGTIQAGLIAGLDEVGVSASVVGVSVARPNPRGAEAVREAYLEVCRRLGREPVPGAVRFEDRWIGGGYEKSTDGVVSVIRTVARTEGLILDPTYTGKAVRALFDLVEEGSIPSGSRVLYWHTGGMLNLLASDYLEDDLRT